MIEEMELKRQRIDEALARLHNDMRVSVAGVGQGKIVIVFAYSVDVRVKLSTGEVVDTTAFQITPVEEPADDVQTKRPRSNDQGRANQRSFVGTRATG